LTHLGWPVGEKWDDVYAYFSVLGRVYLSAWRKLQSRSHRFILQGRPL